MGIREVDLPDGTVGEFPDTMGDDEIAAVLAKQFAPPKPDFADRVAMAAPPPEASSEGDSYGPEAGIAHSISKTVRGVGKLLPASVEKYLTEKGIVPSEEDVQMLRGMRDSSTSGQIAGLGADVVTEALPFSKTTKLARNAGLGTTATAAAQGATGATVGALRAESGDTALSEAGWGAVGGAGGELAGRLVTGGIVRPSAQAQRLINRGVVPTVGEGADQSTLRGKALRWAERQMEAMPVVGGGIRMGQEQAASQLGAASRGVAGISTPAGVPPVKISEALRNASRSYGNDLDTTVVRVLPTHQSAIHARIQDLAGKGSVSQEEADLIKNHVNEKLFAGVHQKQMTASALSNAMGDIRGFGKTTNGSKVSNAIADDIQKWIDAAGTAAGKNLPEKRKTLQDAYALRRGRLSETEGISGPQLASGIERNSKYGEGASRALRDLSDDAQLVRHPATGWRSRDPGALAKSMIGGGKEATTGIMANPLYMGMHAYSAANASPAIRKYLLGQYQANALRRLGSAPAQAGYQATTE